MKEKELCLDEIEKISKNVGNLYFLLLTGGEPFLRDDLSEIVRLFYRNNNLKTLAIPTSGFDCNKIYKTCNDILKSCDGLSITVNISLDDIDELHNKIRGHVGLFNKAVKTYRTLKGLKKEYNNFDVGIITTVSKYNENRLKEIYKFVKEDLNTDIWAIFITRGLPRDKHASDVNLLKYKEINDLVYKEKKLKGYSNFGLANMNNAKNRMRYKLIIDSKTRKIGPRCYAGLLNGVIFEDGKVYACELKDHLLGDLRQNNYNFKEIWNSKKTRDIRKRIKMTNCVCTHECFITTNILFNLRCYPGLFKELLKSWF